MPSAFKLAYQLYSQSDNKQAWNALKTVLTSIPEELFTSNANLLRLNDILSLHQQQDALPSLMKDMGALVLDGIKVLYYNFQITYKK
jgi:hypothetical protein